jgi:hypothetical protein
VSWKVTPPAAANGGCPPQTFTADTTGAVSICRAGRAPNQVVGRVVIRLDRTPPEVTDAVPAREPDHDGWFNRSIRFDFDGTDATSGIARCRSVTYDGPDAADASILGRCKDRAGNAATRSFSLKFDSTPPALSGLTATPGDRRVALQWLSGADVESVEVDRSPGSNSEHASAIFTGLASSFADVHVTNGVRYVYQVGVSDAAGNWSRAEVAAVPSAPIHTGPPTVSSPAGGRRTGLLFPAARATISRRHPPLLKWNRVRRARYYNVQLLRGSRKVLSAWPTRARYQLKRRWNYRGRTYRLRPGRYRWYVWPGFGPRGRARYGDLLGHRSFTVVAK